jgi:two-component system, sensor histidine kinase LadS
LRNFEWFLKEHGTERAERALVLAASAIRAVSRDVDTVGRLGRAELGLLLDGPVDAGDVTKAATQALARSLAPSDALPVGAHLQLHFAVCLLPDGAHAQQPMSAMEIWAWLSDSQRTTEQAPRNRVLAVNL